MKCSPLRKTLRYKRTSHIKISFTLQMITCICSSTFENSFSIHEHLKVTFCSHPKFSPFHRSLGVTFGFFKKFTDSYKVDVHSSWEPTKLFQLFRNNIIFILQHNTKEGPVSCHLEAQIDVDDNSEVLKKVIVWNSVVIIISKYSEENSFQTLLSLFELEINRYQTRVGSGRFVSTSQISLEISRTERNFRVKRARRIKSLDYRYENCTF